MKRVYKFLPEEWARDNIEKQHIKISRFCDLNDPFELSPFDLSNGDQRDALIHARKEFSGGGLARTSRDPPKEPHYGDAVEGSSHVQDRSIALRTGRFTIRPSFDAAM